MGPEVLDAGAVGHGQTRGHLPVVLGEEPEVEAAGVNGSAGRRDRRLAGDSEQEVGNVAAAVVAGEAIHAPGLCTVGRPEGPLPVGLHPELDEMGALVDGDAVLHHPDLGIAAVTAGAAASQEGEGELGGREGTGEGARLEPPQSRVDLGASGTLGRGAPTQVDAELPEQGVAVGGGALLVVALVVGPEGELVDHRGGEHVGILDAPHAGGVVAEPGRKRNGVAFVQDPVVAVVVEGDGVGVGDGVVEAHVPVLLHVAAELEPMGVVDQAAQGAGSIGQGSVIQCPPRRRADQIGGNDVVGERLARKGIDDGIPSQVLLHHLGQVPAANGRRGVDVVPDGSLLVAPVGLNVEMEEGLVSPVIDLGDVDGPRGHVVPADTRLGGRMARLADGQGPQPGVVQLHPDLAVELIGAASAHPVDGGGGLVFGRGVQGDLVDLLDQLLRRPEGAVGIGGHAVLQRGGVVGEGPVHLAPGLGARVVPHRVDQAGGNPEGLDFLVGQGVGDAGLVRLDDGAFLGNRDGVLDIAHLQHDVDAPGTSGIDDDAAVGIGLEAGQLGPERVGPGRQAAQLVDAHLVAYGRAGNPRGFLGRRDLDLGHPGAGLVLDVSVHAGVLLGQRRRIGQCKGQNDGQSSHC